MRIFSNKKDLVKSIIEEYYVNGKYKTEIYKQTLNKIRKFYRNVRYFFIYLDEYKSIERITIQYFDNTIIKIHDLKPENENNK